MLMRHEIRTNSGAMKIEAPTLWDAWSEAMYHAHDRHERLKAEESQSKEQYTLGRWRQALGRLKAEREDSRAAEVNLDWFGRNAGFWFLHRYKRKVQRDMLRRLRLRLEAVERE